MAHTNPTSPTSPIPKAQRWAELEAWDYDDLCELAADRDPEVTAPWELTRKDLLEVITDSEYPT